MMHSLAFLPMVNLSTLLVIGGRTTRERISPSAFPSDTIGCFLARRHRNDASIRKSTSNALSRGESSSWPSNDAWMRVLSSRSMEFYSRLPKISRHEHGIPHSSFCLRAFSSNNDYFYTVSTTSSSSSSFCDASEDASSKDLEPFAWDHLVKLFRFPGNNDPNDNPKDIQNGHPCLNSNRDFYIPSHHLNLALFRRSPSTQATYERHQKYLQQCWKSPYDYLCVQKFGREFGFERMIVKRDYLDICGDFDTGDDVDARNYKNNHDKNNSGSYSISDSSGDSKQDLLTVPPKGYLYRSQPSLEEASQYTISNGVKYLRLVPNDFPYHVDDGIEHWCLWKIGGNLGGVLNVENDVGKVKGVTKIEGISEEEIAWALKELETYPIGDFSGSSLIVGGCDNEASIITTFQDTRANTVTTQSVNAQTQPNPILDCLYWVNPPHLQSMPKIHHAHLLILRQEKEK